MCFCNNTYLPLSFDTDQHSVFVYSSSFSVLFAPANCQLVDEEMSSLTTVIQQQILTTEVTIQSTSQEAATWWISPTLWQWWDWGEWKTKCGHELILIFLTERKTVWFHLLVWSSFNMTMTVSVGLVPVPQWKTIHIEPCPIHQPKMTETIWDSMDWQNKSVPISTIHTDIHWWYEQCKWMKIVLSGSALSSLHDYQHCGKTVSRQHLLDLFSTTSW